jgi:hypothetical protein
MKKLLVVGLIATALVAVVAANEAGLVVTPMWRNGQMLVSFEVSDGMTPELRDGIRSGLSTTFSYEIDVRRGTTTWFTRAVASMTVTSTVQFDNLTRRYQLSRAFDGRLEDTRQTEDEDAMQKWLTRFDRVPVVVTSALEANSEYAVRITLYRSPRNAWFLLPWDRSAVLGKAKFTFLP